MSRKGKPVFRITKNGTDDQPYALHHSETDEIVHVAPTPERCSGFAFRYYGEGIEVRHTYLEG